MVPLCLGSIAFVWSDHFTSLHSINWPLYRLSYSEGFV